MNTPDMITLSQIGDTITINTSYAGGEFLREIEVYGDFGHIDAIAREGDFTLPTIELGSESLTLEFASRVVNRFDHGDSIIIKFDRPIDAIHAFAHIQGFADGSSIKCNVDVIPEPGSVLIGSIGLFFLLRRRR